MVLISWARTNLAPLGMGTPDKPAMGILHGNAMQ